jgi:hypothetical protein
MWCMIPAQLLAEAASCSEVEPSAALRARGGDPDRAYEDLKGPPDDPPAPASVGATGRV